MLPVNTQAPLIAGLQQLRIIWMRAGVIMVKETGGSTSRKQELFPLNTSPPLYPLFHSFFSLCKKYNWVIVFLHKLHMCDFHDGGHTQQQARKGTRVSLSRTFLKETGSARGQNVGYWIA